MLNSRILVQHLPALFLLVVAIGACAPSPGQSGTLVASSPSPLSPSISASTPERTATLIIATPTSALTASPVPQTSTPVRVTESATPIPPGSAPNSAAAQDNSALTRQLYQQVKDGTPVVEIEAPQIGLPNDVHPKQIKKYFRVGAITIGLVLQPSMNVVLDLPTTHIPSFTGLIISEAETPWRKYLEIRDTERSDKHNPYFLWAEQGQLYLSIVDQRGAGSGEGNMKLVRLASTGEWEVTGCYYFGAGYSDVQRDGDYLEFSRNLDKQQAQSAALCQTGAVELLL